MKKRISATSYGKRLAIKFALVVFIGLAVALVFVHRAPAQGFRGPIPTYNAAEQAQRSIQQIQQQIQLQRSMNELSRPVAVYALPVIEGCRLGSAVESINEARHTWNQQLYPRAQVAPKVEIIPTPVLPRVESLPLDEAKGEIVKAVAQVALSTSKAVAQKLVDDEQKLRPFYWQTAQQKEELERQAIQDSEQEMKHREHDAQEARPNEFSSISVATPVYTNSKRSTQPASRPGPKAPDSHKLDLRQPDLPQHPDFDGTGAGKKGLMIFPGLGVLFLLTRRIWYSDDDKAQGDE